RVSYFGSSTQCLFGVFEEPATFSDSGVVLCYPHGPDYAHAFRPFRILANRLTRAGYHVLRFDYSGTGDSCGDVEDTSVVQWITDINCAVEQISMRLNLRAVSVVGLRLGATLAAFAAAHSQRVQNLV